jgi:solute carrier family 30 (zinc transporter), member 9
VLVVSCVDGYGKSVYFWSLVSALGTFWFGAGISGWNSLKDIVNPALELHSIGWEVWGVLSVSFVVDGYVLTQTLKSLMSKKPANMSLYSYCLSLRDPTTAAVFLEDSAACLGVLVAGAGIAVTQCTGMIIWDSLAGLSVAGLMGFMGLYLARMNQRFLLGQAVDKEITKKIREIILARQSVEGMHSMQSQWIGANSFAYKAEVEIDGTYLAAKLLNRYQKEFVNYIHRHEPGSISRWHPGGQPPQPVPPSVATAAAAAIDEDEIRLLLSWYAEDVMRVVEQEVREIEEAIRAEFPEAQYIEIEPDSSQYESGEKVPPGLEDAAGGSKRTQLRKVFRYAIDDGRKMPSSRRLEIDTIKRMHDELNFRSGLAVPSTAPPTA